MKILVADDEKIMLDSFCRILEKEEGLTIETASTGREAIEKAEYFHPDLVMMDIKMPGINGLEALTEIRRLTPSAIFVILSAYDNFNYAQEAIKLNVFSYLVKPINKSSLLDVICHAKHRLDQIKIERQEELELRERYTKLLPLLESEFLHALVTGLSSSKYYEYQKLLGVDFNAGFFLALSYQANMLFPDYDEYSYEICEDMVLLADNVRHLFACFVGPLKTNPITLFVPLTVERGKYKGNTPRGCVNKLIDHLHANGKSQEIIIGVGTVYSDPIKIKYSYYEALQTLNRSRAGAHIIYYSDSPKTTNLPWEEQLTSIFREVWDALSFGNSTKTQMLLDKIHSILLKTSEVHHDHLLFALLQFYLTAYQRVKDSSPLDIFEPSFARLSTIFQSNKSMAEVYHLIAADLKLMVSAVKETRENNLKTIIRKAKVIIDRNYHQHITLEELADTVNISSFYLSRLFKEELGESFSDYLTRLRMEKAIKLLAEGLTIKECCFKVGYNDPNYFSRIFKKHFGVTPTDYREGKRSCDV